jgi:hypothetical protein
MDLLSLYQPRATAPLDEIARLAGYAGKLGMDGARVWSAYQEGKLADIRAYCETDVVNTFLVYGSFQRMRGVLTDVEFAAEQALVRSTLQAAPGAHWGEFLAAWPAG